MIKFKDVFNRKEETNTDTIKISFHLISGNCLTVYKFKRSKFEELKQSLRGDGWKSTRALSDDFGIDFSKVTHYTVEE